MALTKELTVAAETSNISTVTNYIEENLQEAGCPMKDIIKIDIALDEILSNIAFYAYKDTKGDMTVVLNVFDEPKSCTITFRDNGFPYNPLEKSDPDITTSAEDRELGGLGIFMVKKSMDEMTYAYENGQNVLTIRKNFSI
ncbi:MAG: ATP-binding protein [Treponema sp.]|nr:ATP-binding protein [Candidatus Treponema equifaecale]